MPVVDDLVIRRLRTLRDAVARPGEDVLGELLALFERDAWLRVKAIEEAVAGGNGEARRQAAHALKGAAGNVGAARVAATAGHVEKHEIAPDVLALLAREVEAAVAALRVHLSAGA